MSGRGRGGRGGGRGGVIKSLNREQLNSLGVTANEMPVLVTQPPPLYPLHDRRPVPLGKSKEMDYLLILKQDFIDHMQLSPSYLRMSENKQSQPQQEIDKLVAQFSNTKEKYNWSLFPSELRPKLLAKKVKTEVKKSVDIEERLKKLEQLEEGTGGARIKQEVDEDVEEVVDDAMEDADDEMDDGTDYANNYFDNGEAFEDEDDNLDDGPIY